MKKLIILVTSLVTVLVTILVPPAAFALAPEEPHSTTVPAEDSDNVDHLAWLSGCWQGEGGEECWLPPLNGTMLGLNRGPDGEHFETLRIARHEDGDIAYFASPMGRCPATPFLLTESSDRRAVFTNPAHDFPQEIVYWIEGGEDGETDTLHARVSATTEGETRGFEITWQRRSWTPESR
ncbi:MAG: DUF6265 family protein [Thermoanaerobaculia bacterium]|nr:DUF6265 family protein [Thermoanaerobaculia bacterium]